MGLINIIIMQQHFFFEDDEDEVGLTEIVINLREIRNILDKEQIESIIKYLTFDNVEHLKYKF